MEKIKPCPFCGEQAIKISHPGRNWDGAEEGVNIGALHGLWYVGCPHLFFECDVRHCEVHPAAYWYASLEEAVKAWNTRKGEE